MKCSNCNRALRGGETKCPHCGAALHYGGNTEFYRKAAKSTLTMRDVFSDVFKRHSKADGEALFMAGTARTTPSEAAMLREWRKPWLFAWVALIGIALSIGLYAICNYTSTGIAAFLVFGPFVIPLATLIFYWEMNIPRNIPLYEVLLMFLAGGVLSIFISLLFFEFVDASFAPIAAFCEEPGKLLALALFVRKPKSKYILNGILIGGAVGAGFAAIESAGYALKALMSNQGALNSILQRGILAPGGHVVWAAIYGGALVMVKRNETLGARHIFNADFLKYFGIAVGLHFLWNFGIRILPLPFVGDLSYVLLIAVAWAVLLVMYKKGIQQVLAVSAAPADAAGAGAQLIGLCGPYAGNTISLSGEALVFGRDPVRCNILFAGTVPGISRCHCTLRCSGDAVLLTDEHSSYGTFLDNGTKLSPGVPVSLSSGQRFYLGGKDTMFEVRRTL